MNNSIFQNVVSDVSENTETEMNNNEEIILKDEYNHTTNIETDIILDDILILENNCDTGYRLRITDKRLIMYNPKGNERLTWDFPISEMYYKFAPAWNMKEVERGFF